MATENSIVPVSPAVSRPVAENVETPPPGSSIPSGPVTGVILIWNSVQRPPQWYRPVKWVENAIRVVLGCCSLKKREGQNKQAVSYQLSGLSVLAIWSLHYGTPTRGLLG